MAGASSTVTIERRGDREIVYSREFDAPRELVFKVLTDPKLIPNWWGPRAYKTVVDKMEVRPGGAWRYLNITPDGQEHAFRGVYREIVPPSKLVLTFEWEGMPGHISVQTMVLEAKGDKTLVTATAVFDTKADRDGMWESGAQTGGRETWERLAEVISAQRSAVRS
jgi:uncharacterized protein YndB with AHSA1/START domain